MGGSRWDCSDLVEPPEDAEAVRVSPADHAGFRRALGQDPGHREHAHLLEFVGGSFDPARFDRKHVNEMLAGVRLE